MKDSPPSAGSPPQAAKDVWGLWPTIGLSLVVIGALFAVQIAVLIVAVVYRIALDPGTDPEALAESITKNTELISVASLLSNVVVVLLLALFIYLKRGATLTSYLDLKKPPAASAALWAGVCLAYCVAVDLLFMVTGLDEGAASREMYRNARFLPLLILTVNVAAPVVEELLFRGFMFEGLRASRGGPAIAIVVTSMVWSIVHVQYTIAYIAVIFLGGVMLGYARVRTRSLCTSILMHFVWNLYATITIAASLK